MKQCFVADASTTTLRTEGYATRCATDEGWRYNVHSLALAALIRGRPSAASMPRLGENVAVQDAL